MAWYQISDCERVLVNTSVVLLAAISSSTCGSIVRPRWPPHGKRSARPGSSESTTSFLGTAPCTSTPSCSPSKACMASCRLPSVADMPHTASPAFQRLSRASASCTCTPRLLPSSSCHSSTTTILTRPSTSLASARASSSDRLSGVVTSTVGRRSFCALRSADEVSPLRAPALQRCTSMPWASIASSGCCSARSVSAASARMGVIHSTVSGGGGVALALREGGGAADENACSAPSHTA